MDSRTEAIVVEQTQPGQRLDVFLHSRYPSTSRGTLQRMIEEGNITVNGQPVKPSHTPHRGEELQITWPPPRPAEALPEDIPLDILYEDEDVLVLNKPPGMVVHPSAGNQEHTIVNAILHHCQGQLSGIGGVARPGIVHRLDKDTSGCLLIAKNDAAHIHLAEQFQNRLIEKTYHAVVCGILRRESGEIHAAIARHPTHRKRMAVREEGGREAWTSFKVVKYLNHATLVAATLHSGRTHQIRVHFQHLGYPLAGDDIYGAKASRRLAEATGYAAPRQLLHASVLGFIHPVQGKKMVFEAPWPMDFNEAIAALEPLEG